MTQNLIFQKSDSWINQFCEAFWAFQDKILHFCAHICKDSVLFSMNKIEIGYAKKIAEVANFQRFWLLIIIKLGFDRFSGQFWWSEKLSRLEQEIWAKLPHAS